MANTHAEGLDPKVVSMVSYLTLIGWIVALVLNKSKSELASFHLRQSLGVILVFMASSFVAVVPFIGWLVGFAGFLLGILLWIVGFIGAIKGEMKPVPIVGDYFQEWFKAI
jgi:uncharacterized membrane protein